MTRLDVAYDDHTGILDIDKIAQDTQDQHFISRMRYWETVRSANGVSVMIGSPQSKTRIRIYDKAAERGCADGEHWVRVELQLRDGRAEEFSKIPMDVGEAFAGVLLNYLRYVVPDPTDGNKSRWETAGYWYALIGDVSRIKIFSVPGGAYNLERCRHYVFDMAGNAIDAMLQICDSFEDFVTLVNMHFAREEAFAAKVQEYFTVEDEPDVCE